MLDLLLKVLMLGIASAASPVIFGITLSLLADKENGKIRAAALLGGGIAGVLVLLAIGAAAGSHLSGYGAEIRAQAKAMDLGLAVAFLLFAGFSLFSKDRTQAPSAAARRAGLLKWVAAGFVLNATNLDAVLLLLTEAKEIFQSAVFMPGKVALMALGAGLFLLPTLLPLAVYALRPDRAARLLGPVGAFMRKYGRYLAAAVFLGFGAYLAWRGLM
jgi:hypothetical protein